MNGIPVDINSYPPTMTDAFGRLRISQQLTLFDSFHRFQDNGKINVYTSNTASSSYNSNAGCISISVGSNLGDRVYRESSRVFAYQPGKSLLVLHTFCLNEGKDGLRQRIGYFDTLSGVYLQMNGTTLSFVRRSNVSGTLKETIVEQDNWNYDNMKGNGPSRNVLNTSRVQIMFLDIEWLGVGSIRVGFVIDGRFCICHTFHHANRPSTLTSDSTLPYMATACLPVRAELENIAPTGTSSSFNIICTSIVTEGGYELRGKQHTAGITILSVPKTLPLKDTFYPVVAIRLKADRLGAIVVPTHISMIGTVASDYRWAIISNPTVSGGNSWISVSSDSSVEYKLDATNAITDGTILRTGYFTSTNTSSSVISLDSNLFRFQLERNSFTGVAYPFVLACSSKADADKVLGSIDFEEIT